MVVIEVQDLPIAVRKGVGAYTRKPRYPWSHFVSYDKISSNHKSFLGHQNTVTIPKTIDETLNIKDSKNAMKVEMVALVNNKGA